VSHSRRRWPRPPQSWLGLKRWSARSIRARKPPHSEFDAVARKFAPGFDLGHVGGLWIPAKDFARLFARLVARQCESLAAKSIAGARLERLGRAARDIGGTAAVTHDTPDTPVLGKCSAQRTAERVGQRSITPLRQLPLPQSPPVAPHPLE